MAFTVTRLDNESAEVAVMTPGEAVDYVGTPGPNSLRDTTTISTLTEETAAPFLVASNTLGNRVRKLTLTAWGRSNLLASVPAGRVPYSDASGLQTSNAGLAFDPATGATLTSNVQDASTVAPVLRTTVVSYRDSSPVQWTWFRGRLIAMNPPVNVPSLVFGNPSGPESSGFLGDGFGSIIGNGGVGVWTQHTPRVAWYISSQLMKSDTHLVWGSGNITSVGGDAGFIRDSLNTMRTTNGSNGVGSLITGNLTVRQPLGTAGTDQLELSHDGSLASLSDRNAAKGRFLFTGTGGDCILMFGGTGTQPALRPNGQILQAMRANESGNAPVTASEFRVTYTSNLGGWVAGNDPAAALTLGFTRFDDNTVEVTNGVRTASGGALRGLNASTLTATAGVTLTGGDWTRSFNSNLMTGSYLLRRNNDGTPHNRLVGMEAAQVVLSLRGAVSQTGNLLQCENNAGTAVASVSSDGSYTTSGGAVEAFGLRCTGGGWLRVSTGVGFQADTSGCRVTTLFGANGTSATGSPDVTLSRVSPGVWQMGTTAANALGSLNLTNLTARGSVAAQDVSGNLTVTASNTGTGQAVALFAGGSAGLTAVPTNGSLNFFTGNGGKVIGSFRGDNGWLQIGDAINQGGAQAGLHVQHSSGSAAFPVSIFNGPAGHSNVLTSWRVNNTEVASVSAGGGATFSREIDLNAIAAATHGLTLRTTGGGRALRVMSSDLGTEFFSVSSGGVPTLGTNKYIEFPHSSLIGDPNQIVTGGGAGLGITSSGSIFFATGGSARRLTLDASGNLTVNNRLVVGTTSTSANGTNPVMILVPSSDGGIYVSNNLADSTNTGAAIRSILANSSNFPFFGQLLGPTIFSFDSGNGFVNKVSHRGSGSVGSGGFFADSLCNGAGVTYPTSRSYHSYLYLQSGATVTNHVGYGTGGQFVTGANNTATNVYDFITSNYTGGNLSGQTITNRFGLYLGHTKAGGNSASAWGVYQVSADVENYFAGPVNFVNRIQTNATGIGLYGVTPVARQTVAADATDLATAITLVNDLKAKLTTLGAIQ